MESIGFIGAGNMASWLISGLIKAGHPPDALAASCPHEETLSSLKTRTNIHTTTNNQQLVRMCDIILLCVKPQQIETVLADIQPTLTSKHIIVSVAAGIQTTTIERYTPQHCTVMRCMPNIAASVGASTTLLYAHHNAPTDTINTIESIMRTIGTVVHLDTEDALHIGTALSGSGPAFIFHFLAAIEHSATKLGLNTEQAKLITLDTLLGSARTAIASDQSLVSLCARIASPGGTTEAGLQVLNDQHIDETVFTMLQTAANRSRTIAQQAPSSDEK